MAIVSEFGTFPTKKAASIAMFAAGRKPKEIADEIGSTEAAVRVTIKEARREGRLPMSVTGEERKARVAGEMWTPEKAAKARAALIYVAEALSVTLQEIAELCVVAGAVEVQTPTRDDDEAELARLAAEESEEVPDDVNGGARSEPIEDLPPIARLERPKQFRLIRGDGQYLHRDVNRFTYTLAEAWQGTAPDYERLIKVDRKYEALEMTTVR